MIDLVEPSGLIYGGRGRGFIRKSNEIYAATP
jgi:hypothetical protein